MNKSEDRVTQVKKDINGEVRLIFAIAFFVMFLGCGILLLLTEHDSSVLWTKGVLLLLIFLFMYLVCARIIKGRVDGLFAPVDSYIKDNDQKLDLLQKENDDNIGSIKAAIKDNENIKNTAFDSVRAFNKSNKTIVDNEKEITALHARQDELYSNINKTKANIARIKSRVKLGSADLMDVSKRIQGSAQELNKDYEELAKSLESMQDNMVSCTELIDTLLTELTVMQDALGQVNANSSHIAIENARLGRYSFVVTNGLDEIKRLSIKLGSKTDEIASLAMRSRTDIRLAEEQADYCIDTGKAGNSEMTQVIDNSNIASEMTSGLNSELDSLIEELGKLYEFNDELIRLGEQGRHLSQSTYKENETLAKVINNMGESLKNK